MKRKKREKKRERERKNQRYTTTMEEDPPMTTPPPLDSTANQTESENNNNSIEQMETTQTENVPSVEAIQDSSTSLPLPPPSSSSSSMEDSIPSLNASNHSPSLPLSTSPPPPPLLPLPSEISVESETPIQSTTTSVSSSSSVMEDISSSSSAVSQTNELPSETHSSTFLPSSPITTNNEVVAENNSNLLSNQENGGNNGGREASDPDKMQKQMHAMDFLYKVRTQYQKVPAIYNQFLEIMKDFKSAAIETPEVITRVKELFRGNNYLIQEFNAFLPAGYKIEPDPEPTPSSNNLLSSSFHPKANSTESRDNQTTNQPAELQHARNYVRKIKNRFAHQPHIYKTFLDILHSYYQGEHVINEVLDEVAELFSSHSDLLEEFKQFLPKTLSEVSGPPTGKDVNSSLRSESIRASNKIGNSKKKAVKTEKPKPNFTRDRSPSSIPTEKDDSRKRRRMEEAYHLPCKRPSLIPYQENFRRFARYHCDRKFMELDQEVGRYKDLDFFDVIKHRIPRKFYIEFLRNIESFSQGNKKNLKRQLFNVFSRLDYKEASFEIIQVVVIRKNRALFAFEAISCS
eukprot:TRINITY_DN103_c0_g3_i3.p2 TRINITY_DN103_c0_g3~~TRINITY_DN103_c0_g3_i3.p2  ORF type:complete len:573 (-),score=173.36 TRINITY_DN103_c0_g3_i3:484-2202(-)